MAAEALRFDDVTKRFGTVVAVDGADFAVADGEFFAMLGPSGSGKTTCLRLVAGFERPTSGRVLLHGQDVSRLAPFQRDVNTVFQDYALFPHMSVADNVGYGLTVRKIGRAERTQRIEEALALVRLPVGEFGSRRPVQLSGGQRQRVALARALTNRPRVLLLDEPLGALDLKLRQEMQGELKRIQREVGITFVFVTHDQEEALIMSDRLAVFNNGRVEQVGQPADVYDRPQTEFVAGFVGTSNIIRGNSALPLTGTSQAVSVRPEKIRLTSTSEAAGLGHIAVDGRLAEVEFLGTYYRYRVEADGFDVVAVRQNDGRHHQPDGPVPGDRVRAIWSRAAMRPLHVTDPLEVSDGPDDVAMTGSNEPEREEQP